MAKTDTRPQAKKPQKETPPIASPDAHDAPGLSPFERMRELTRAVVNVPKDEADRKRGQRKR
jgi:hypothetical protein